MSKYLIVGGVAGGATTAARLRRNDESAQIVLFEKGEHISYANCGLPYYLGGTITDRDKLFVQTPETFQATLNVDVRVNNEVVAIDRAAKTVTVKRHPQGTTYTETYDKLVLSPGAEPVRPPIVGIDTPGIFTLRNVADTDRIKKFVDERQPRRAVVIGAGFIGLEMAENLHQRGVFVTIVEMAAQVMVMLDHEMAAEVHQHFKVKGVECYLGDGVQSLKSQGEKISMKLSSGKDLETDMVILSIGVRPDSALAAAAGIELGTTRGIKVNEFLQTSDPSIYAVGDAIEFPSPITGKPTITYLAGPANKQGRICADNLVFGNKSRYKGAIATAVAKVFDLTVGSTGASEKLLKKEGIPFHSCVTHGSSHAGYYPGAMAMTLKLLFSPEGKILGAQGVGYEGIDKRIDMVAVLLGKKGTIEDLTEVEHAYAPPYSSAKDPVNVLGFVAQNILAGRTSPVRWDQLQDEGNRVPDQAFLLDVRTPDEFGIHTLPGAVNIPLPLLRSRLGTLPKDKKIIAFCGVGLRSYMAERILKQNGFHAASLSGGYKTYEHATMKQSNEDLFTKDFIGKDSRIYQTDPERTDPIRPSFVKLLEVDAVGLQCPGPILKLKTEMDKLPVGGRLRETASDPGFASDVASWAKMTGNTLVELTQEKGRITAVVEKGQGLPPPVAGGSGTTLIVFSDDMDKALASLVIANGAAGAGKQVTLFFTFWGLNVIKKVNKPAVKKDLLGRMFGLMLPSSLHKLALSKLHMGGMGTAMMKGRMKSLKIDSLQEMLDAALKSGVRMVACTMSMDVMGVTIEELIDGVESGGVATMLEAADASRATFFI